MLYDYKCESCEHELIDVYQSINDKPKKVCPKCKKHKLNRVFSAGIGGFVKGGSGTVGSLADSNATKNASQINEIEAKPIPIALNIRTLFSNLGVLTLNSCS